MKRLLVSTLGNERAMTLIELLVVCVIMGIAFLGVAGLFPLGTQNLNESRMRTVATDLAQEKMEELLSTGSSHADLTVGSHTDSDNPIRTTFNRFWTVTDNTPMTGMKMIEVQVTYPHGTTTRDIRVVTYKQS